MQEVFIHKLDRLYTEIYKIDKGKASEEFKNKNKPHNVSMASIFLKLTDFEVLIQLNPHPKSVLYRPGYRWIDTLTKCISSKSPFPTNLILFYKVIAP